MARPVIECALVLALFVVSSLALHSFPAYRLVQYDQGGDPYGSAKTSFNLGGALVPQSSPSSSLALVLAEGVESAKSIVNVHPP